LKSITIEGRISSGEGVGSQFVKLPWVEKQFEEKLGFIPYSGTLNIRLSHGVDISKLKNAEKRIRINSLKGLLGGWCFKALIMKRLWGAIVVPDVQEYPDDLLEILAPVNLRKTLGLKDGMEIEITVWLE